MIPANATQLQALELKQQHEEEKRLYLECRNVEKALLRHIQEALEEQYIGHLVDEFTNLLTGDVPTILEYLFYNYGKVRSEEVTQKEQEVMSMSWQPSDPMVVLTRPVEDLQKLATQAGIPYTDSQILEKGLTIIRATRDFEYALMQWEAKPQADKTWANFKTHFHEAQLQLKQIRGPTMQQSGFHHANMLAQELTTKFEEHLAIRDSQLLSVMQSIPGLAETSSSSDSETSLSHTANYTSSDTVQLEILKLLKELRADIKRESKQSKRDPKPGSNPKTPDDATKKRWHTNKYCWTHGGCGHTSDKCNTKAEGHQDEATFERKMGGSKAYCS